MERRVNVACLQETKRKDDKANELTYGYKFYYKGKKNARNRVGITIDNNLKEIVIDQVKRVHDVLIAIKSSIRGRFF